MASRARPARSSRGSKAPSPPLSACRLPKPPGCCRRRATRCGRTCHERHPMKGTVIALGAVNGREAAALIEDGRLADLLIDSDRPRPGTIYRARADRPVKGLAPGQPLLVQVTGHAEPGKALPVTSKLLFKSRYAIVTPAAPGLNVSRQIRDDDRRDELLAIAHAEMDGVEMGLILRSSCLEADDGEIAEDIRAMVDLATAVLGDAEGAEPEKLTEGDGPHTLAWREWTDPADVEANEGSFADHGALDALDEAQDASVPLTGGASMFIEPTRALVAVDVNTDR